MTFKKNYEREILLLGCWNLGYTVKATALMTGIPAGSISHYFARFNKDPVLYREKAGTQDPPRSSTPDLVSAAIIYSSVTTKVNQCILDDDYGKARDVLLTALLSMDLYKRFAPIFQNADPEKWGEFVLETAKIYTAFSQVQKMSGQ